MTTQELIDYYVGLLIIQYSGKPKAEGTVSAFVAPVVMDSLPLQIQTAFNIDTAVGVQLDVLGKYVGVSRSARTFTALVSLDDSDYRLLIKMKIAKNHSYATLSDIQDIIKIFFAGILRVFDYKNMRMEYFFDSNAGSLTLAEVFIRQELLPRPMGVQLGALIYAPDVDHFFGMRSYDMEAFGVSGFNSYTNYVTGTPWLSYADALFM